MILSLFSYFLRRKMMRLRKSFLKILLSMVLLVTMIIPVMPLQAYASPTTVENKRLAGDSRSLTAVEISKEGWPSGSNAVILAREDNFPDALAGAVLAAAYDAPILLTSSKTLTPATASEIERLQAQTVYILGGTNAISADIETALAAKYTVQRITGGDRYETSANIAKYLQQNDKLQTQKAVVAYAQNFPDALAVSSWAAQNGVPILLAETNTLPAATREALTALQVTDTVITGGTGVISAQVASQLPGPTRYGGDNRYETAVDLINGLGQATDTIFVATGLNFPDALAGSALAAKQGKAILLTGDGLDASVETFLAGKVGQINKIYTIGGTNVVKPAALNQILSFIVQEQPEEAFASAMNALKALDENTADRYFNYEDLTIDQPSTSATFTEEDVAALLAKLDYKIVSSKINGDTATVTAEITNTDAAAVMESYVEAVVQLAMQQAALPKESQMSEEELEQQLAQIFIGLIKDEQQTTTTTVEVNLVKNHNSWTITMDEPFQDALLGGMISSIKDLSSQQV
jgi:putative cell wall-binding protein